MEKKGFITRLGDTFCHVEKVIVCITFILMLALLFIQVLCRYVFNLPLAWAEEAVRYVYIAVSFLGAAIAAREGTHIKIDILPTVLKHRIKDPNRLTEVINLIDLIADLITCAFFIMISAWMLSYNINLKELGNFTTNNQWPVWLMCLPETVSCILIGFHYLLNGIESVGNILQAKRGGTAS